MQVIAGARAGVSHETYYVSFNYLLAYPTVNIGQMRVLRHETVSMPDYHGTAVSGTGTGGNNHAIGRCMNSRSIRGRQIDAGMKLPLTADRVNPIPEVVTNSIPFPKGT